MLTVEELAERTGQSVRTIRYYQGEGVLPPPLRQGREARYDDTHVERLKVISQLQRRGLRLNAIRELLQHSEAFEDLGETLARPWSEDHPVLLDEAALRARLTGLGPEALDGLIASGVVEPRGDTIPVTYLVPSPGMLDVAVAIIGLGIKPDVALHLRDLLVRHLRQAAEELVEEFTRTVTVNRLADQGPTDLARLLEELQPLTRRTVELLFAHEMERAQRSLLDGEADPAEVAHGLARSLAEDAACNTGRDGAKDARNTPTHPPRNAPAKPRRTRR